MISYGDGEPISPFTLLKESDNFDEIYYEFNNNRGTPCVIFLKEDLEWKDKMNLKDKFITTALTWPLLLKYRYLNK